MTKEEIIKDRESVTFLQWLTFDKMQLTAIILTSLTLFVLVPIIGYLNPTDIKDTETIVTLSIMYLGLLTIIPYKVIQSFKNYKKGFSL